MMIRKPWTAIILFVFSMYLLAGATLLGVLHIINENNEINEKIEAISSYYQCECDCEYCGCGELYEDND